MKTTKTKKYMDTKKRNSINIIITFNFTYQARKRNLTHKKNTQTQKKKNMVSRGQEKWKITFRIYYRCKLKQHKDV